MSISSTLRVLFPAAAAALLLSACGAGSCPYGGHAQPPPQAAEGEGCPCHRGHHHRDGGDRDRGPNGDRDDRGGRGEERGDRRDRDDRDDRDDRGDRGDWRDGPRGDSDGPRWGHDGREGRRGPPPEAIEACGGKKVNDECTVRRDEWERKGVCIAPPKEVADGKLVCAPQHKGPEGDAPKPPAPGAKPAK